MRFFLTILLALTTSNYLFECKTNVTVRISEGEILKFREKNVINKLNDMENVSEDAKAILAKIEHIRNKASIQLTKFIDLKKVCAIQIKFRIDRAMNNAKENCDLCIANNVDLNPSNMFNDNQKNCIYNILHSAEMEIEQLESMIPECKNDNVSSSTESSDNNNNK